MDQPQEQGCLADPDCHRAVYRRGLCRRHRAQLEQPEGPYQRLPYNRDELLDEWVFMREFVPFEDFGPRVGIKPESWQRAFERAKALGDPRAAHARNDRSHWPDPAAGLSQLLRRREAA